VVFAPTKDEESGSAEDGTLGEGLAQGRFTAEVVVSFTWSRAEGREE
jgi:hypothetical protein